MNKKILVLYHRMPFDEVLVNGRMEFRELDKPNGIIPLLKSFFATIEGGVWIAASDSGRTAGQQLRETIRMGDGAAGHILRRIPLSRDEMHHFYHLTAEEGFWPILHSFPEKFNPASVHWEGFLDINRRFAQAAIEESDEDTIIWVHDFNLWLVPYFIRKARPAAEIAFFLHTCFPSPDIFNLLPWRREILESLLACDLLSFDIPRFAENFVAAARSCLPVMVRKRSKVRKEWVRMGTALSEPTITTQIAFNNRTIRLDAFPEGTDLSKIEKLLAEKRVRKKIEETKNCRRGVRSIFSASRMDYIKGIKELLMCYDRLLTRKPELPGNIELFLVAVEPPQGIGVHKELQADIHRLIDGIRKKHGKEGWEPVIYCEQALSFEEMVIRFSIADIMWVTSLRDGMNITCKEFVAVKKDSGGVLVLSEFAGASVELTGAVLTNPYSSQSMDDAIDQALDMPLSLQVKRMKKMYHKALTSDVEVWARQIYGLHNTRKELQY